MFRAGEAAVVHHPSCAMLKLLAHLPLQ